MKRIFLLLLIVADCIDLAAQEYFQQEVNYQIKVVLNDDQHLLDGTIRIEYINNSPHTLNFIYMHVWPNAYSSSQSALAKQLLKLGELDFHFSDETDGGSISGFNYHVNEVPAFYDSVDVDIQKLNLPEALEPGGTAIIETPFKVKIPSARFSRLGHLGQSYQITQWYPKPAVYDQSGWHPMPYINQGEFYSEFGSFEVSITLPENYVVMATGNLQEQHEIQWLEEKAKKTASIEVFETSMDFPPSSALQKTITFKETNVHDFAWFADKRFHVLKSEVVLPYSQKKVTTWSAFTNSEAALWKNSSEYLNDAIYYYSLWNGEYPYQQAAAIDGTISAGSGMEYPTITIIGTAGSAKSLETVIMHEVGHNWFYGMLGSNERRYPWLDEGLNSLNELRYLETKYPDLNVLNDTGGNGMLKFLRANRLLHKDQYQMLYLFNARRNLDQPINLPSADYTSTNYGAIVYSKSAIVFNYLRHYLGDEAFDIMMQSYFEEWKFKHPQPTDFLSYVDEALLKKSDWIYNLINTTQKTDFKVSSLKKSASDYELKIKSLGRLKGPVSYSLLSKTDSVIVTNWIEPFDKTTTVKINDANFHRITLDYIRVSPDLNRKNNEVKRRGLIRKTAPLRLQWLAGIEEPERTTLYFSPVVGFNTSDGFMAGLLLHNYSLFQKQIEYKLAPLYGFNSQDFNWMGSIRYNFKFEESRAFENIKIEAVSSSFSTLGAPNWQRFEKYGLITQLDFKRNPLNKNFSHHINYNLSYIVEGVGSTESSSLNAYNTYGFLSYTLRNALPLRPYRVVAAFDITDQFDRFSIEANAKFVFNKKGRGLKTRLFFGSFIYNDEENNNPRYNWRMDGINGFNDFSYNHIYLGRNDLNNGFSQQFVEGHGNFKVPTAFGQSNLWISALNLKFESPVKIPIGLFADIGINARQQIGDPNLFYDAGIYFWIIPEAIEVYFPLIYSDAIRDEHNIKGINYWSLIRFMINFNEINPFTILKKVAP